MNQWNSKHHNDRRYHPDNATCSQTDPFISYLTRIITAANCRNVEPKTWLRSTRLERITLWPITLPASNFLSFKSSNRPIRKQLFRNWKAYIHDSYETRITITHPYWSGIRNSCHQEYSIIPKDSIVNTNFRFTSKLTIPINNKHSALLRPSSRTTS